MIFTRAELLNIRSLSAYLLKKGAEALTTLLALGFLTFCLARAVPGGPFDGERVSLPHIRSLQESKYGFDRGVLDHFCIYLSNFAGGDWGVSLKFIDRPVKRILIDSLPNSALLGSLALFLSSFVGLFLGTLSHLWNAPLFCRLVQGVVTSILALPLFLYAAILVLIFSQWLEILPPARLEGPLSYVLPVIALSLRPTAIIVDLTQTLLGEQSICPHVRTARAKGLSEPRVVLGHLIRPALASFLGVLSPMAANILTGSFIVEHFFAIPGIAKHFIDAALNRDVFLMMGVTWIFGGTMVLLSFFSDFLSKLLDPRFEL